MKILLVDDNEDILLTLSVIFEALECDVITENNAPNVLSLVQKQHPQIIIMDIGMPVMNGFELCSKLRENSFTMPIIAHTGWGSASDKEKAHIAGFNDILVKPASFEDYKRIVAKYVR